MITNPSFEGEKGDAPSALLRQFEEAHREEISAITGVLAKITSLSPEEITFVLTALMERSVVISFLLNDINIGT